MRWFLIVLAALTLAIGATACGGDDESAGDTTEFTDSIDETTSEDETTTDEETTDGATTDAETTDAETDTDVPDFAAGDCQELGEATSAIGTVLSGAASQDEIDAASERFREFADNVPEEIRADVLVLADMYEKYAEAFADLDLQVGETPSAEQIQQIIAVAAEIDQAAVTEASTNLSTWIQENC